MSGERISVLIASIGRMQLLDTLRSIDDALTPADCDVEVVVADDSPQGSVEELLSSQAFHRPIRVLRVGARNVSVARNALLDAAAGEWGLFVDDDEVVEREWLVGHVSAARDFKADAVFGPVRFVYPDDTPEWFRRIDPMALDLGWDYDGKPVTMGVSGNTFLRMETIRRFGLRFDPIFGRSGGGDSHFFQQLAAAGARMVVTDRAPTWEKVPAGRANPAYMFDRSKRNGQSYALGRLTNASSLSRFGFTVVSMAKLMIAGTATQLARPFSRRLWYQFNSMTWSNIGKLRAIAGLAQGDGWRREA